MHGSTGSCAGDCIRGLAGRRFQLQAEQNTVASALGRGRTVNTGRTAVIPGAFTYHRPASVAEAVGLLADLGEDARPLAGGHSLIPMMKLRLATPAHLVDLAGLKDLKGISTDGADVVIGAMTTQHELIGHEA